jgi:hypothetical protein
LKGDITRRVKLDWLPLNNQLLAVITLSCSKVLLLLLGIQAITHEMFGLLTIVTQVGWQASLLRNLLLIFLNEAELLLLSLSYPRGLRVNFACSELSGLASVATSFALTRTSLLISDFPLTYIYF